MPASASNIPTRSRSYLRDQELAGLDICTDGDARFDTEVAGYSWFSYALTRLGGVTLDHAYGRPQVFGRNALSRAATSSTRAWRRASRRPSSARWRAASCNTRRCGSPRSASPRSRSSSAPSPPSSWACRCATSTTRAGASASSRSAEVLHDELAEVAAAGCTVIQIEEPQVHLLGPARRHRRGAHARFHGRGVQQHRARPARQDRESGAIPAGAIRRSSACSPRRRAMRQRSKRSTAAMPMSSPSRPAASGGMDLEAIGKRITDKKVAIGVIDHHTLQVETPEEVADSSAARSSTSRPSGW